MSRSSRTPSNRRELSQNFLIDRSVIDRLVAVARPTGLVLEPGGGSGALTRALTPRATVWTWEVDPHWVEMLRRTTDARVIAGDFARARVPDRPFAVVGNIPFSVTSRIVDWCLAAPTMRSATLLTQVEYALKRSGGYGRWSRLTALTWPTHEWTYHGRVPASAFRPRPRVDSGILRIDRRERPLLTPVERLAHARIVRAAFLGVGGSVGASLARDVGRESAGRALGDAGVAPSALSTTVHPDAWVVVARRIAR